MGQELKWTKCIMSDIIQIQDLTESVLSGAFQPDPASLQGSSELARPSRYEFNPVVTKAMLDRRPKLKAALAEELQGLSMKWETAVMDGAPSEEPEGFADEQLLNTINVDPYVQALVIEGLVELDDCAENEGEPTYRPSIFDTNVLDPNVQYRESCDDSVASKYEHLSTESIDMIYSDPQVRALVSRMKQGQITDSLIHHLAQSARPRKEFSEKLAGSFKGSEYDKFVVGQKYEEITVSQDSVRAVYLGQLVNKEREGPAHDESTILHLCRDPAAEPDSTYTHVVMYVTKLYRALSS